jgi:septal ring factor EnvC (AmiA/AmiB activator)
MDTESMMAELNAQLDSITHRLINIEEKLDAQAKSDHEHDLKLQKLEIDIKNIEKENSELRIQFQGVKTKINEDVAKDFRNLGDKIRELENRPDKQKANLVNSIADQAFKWVIAATLAALAAWFIANFKTGL